MIAGLGLLLMAIPAVFANFIVVQGLVVPGDAEETANNIIENEMQFHIGILCFIIVIILDVLVAWALYIFLKPVNINLSLLMATFRLVYAAIFAAALNNLGNVLHLISGDDYLTAFDTDQLNAQVMVSINAFEYGWSIASIFFGLHLFVLGYLVFRSGYLPKILGILVIVSSLGYLIDNIGIILSSDYVVIIGNITFIFEIIFAIWLVLKGGKTPEMNGADGTPAETTEAKAEEIPAETPGSGSKMDDE